MDIPEPADGTLSELVSAAVSGHPDMVEGGYSAGSTVAWHLGRFRPLPELSGYRMLLDNVYNCSSNLHSGSGIGRGSSYNCWTTIARDLDLDS